MPSILTFLMLYDQALAWFYLFTTWNVRAYSYVVVLVIAN